MAQVNNFGTSGRETLSSVSGAWNFPQEPPDGKIVFLTLRLTLGGSLSQSRAEIIYIFRVLDKRTHHLGLAV